MSRLDSFIRRLEAQRACLAYAAGIVRAIPGPVLELGLGNGRTYDHLLALLPDRAIFAFDRALAVHPGSAPEAGRLVLGDLRATLPGMRAALGAAAALAHADIGSGDEAASRALAADLAPLVDALLAPGAVVVSDQPMARPNWTTLALPAGVRPGRYHLYRRR